MNRETIIQIAREAGLAEVTDTNQNLRQAEQALLKRYAELVNSGDAGNWYQEAELEVIAARQALALPTAEQVDDINVAESFTSVTKTAAPVGERDAFEQVIVEAVGSGAIRRWPNEKGESYENARVQDYRQGWLWGIEWQARAALSAGDAVDAQRYRWLADCNNYEAGLALIIDPKLTEQALGAAIDAAMRKDKL